MARFAQIVDGRVVNPCDGPDLITALHNSFAPGFVLTQGADTWVEVPDGAPANATLDGNGGWQAVAQIEDVAQPAPIPADVIAARLDDLSAKIDKITEHLGIETGDLP